MSRFAAGDRVAGVLPHGGAAELAVVPEAFTFPLPDGLSFDAAAGLPWITLVCDTHTATKVVRF